MKPGKHQRSKQRYQYLGWKVYDCTQSSVLPSYTMYKLRNNTILLVRSSVWSKQLLCFVQGQGQKREQKHTTKNFVGFHNHFPLLTMLRDTDCYDFFVRVSSNIHRVRWTTTRNRSIHTFHP